MYAGNSVNRLHVVFLAMRIHPHFDNGSSTVRSFIHILVHVLDNRYGRTYFHVHVRVVLGCQVKIIQDNPSVIHHVLHLWIYKNAGLTALVLGVPINITSCFFAKGTQVSFFALSMLHTLCVEKIWATWPMHHARNDRFVRLRMAYWAWNLGQYHRIVVLGGAQFWCFI